MLYLYRPKEEQKSMDKKEFIQNKIEELEERLKDTNALDFANEHNADDYEYFDDAIQEFADGLTSVYYSDQRKYYDEHSSECEDALTSIYNSEDIAQYIKNYGLEGLICHAGALGEFEAIRGEIYDNIEDIIRLLAYRYALKNYDNIVDIDKAIENIEVIDDSDINKIEDIVDYCFELKEEEE